LSYKIKIPLFEGPFDLLLFFIERDEIDIKDIPIATITKDFLDYIENLESMNIEVASEFIVVAATLMRIKSKMLLPRLMMDEDGNELDPRDELVKHLLEYKKFKSVIEDFKSFEKYRNEKHIRGNLYKEIKSIASKSNIEIEMQDVNLYKLLTVFNNAINKLNHEKNIKSHEIIQYPYTIEKQKKYILNLIKSKSKIAFSDLIDENPLKILIIYNFLAILDLIQNSKVFISIGDGLNNFWLSFKP
tara:strand:- start:6079 stop:6813 length:735 start_codon:yes stop_codon:yes gene_type:complete